MISYLIGILFSALGVFTIYAAYKKECTATFIDYLVASILIFLSWVGLLVMVFAIAIYHISNYIDDVVDKIANWIDNKKNKEE